MRTSLIKIYNTLVDYFNSTDWQGFVLPLKIFSVALSVFLLIAIIILISKIRKDIKKSLVMIAESLSVPDLPKQVMEERWRGVENKLAAGDENSYKLAIIEADKIFDELLKRLNLPGQDMGERLKGLSSNQIGNLDDVWQAHRLRNRIVHEPDFRPNVTEVKRAIDSYQRTLRSLEAI
ncbi:MAG: hypothetical protein ABIF84_02245 [Patescibacteria group bacterium]